MMTLLPQSPIFFEPYIGERLISAKTKILVLGESHYGKPEEYQPTFTREVVNRYLNYKEGKQKREKWMTTYSRFANTVQEDSNPKVSPQVFWESIMFYNYVQTVILTKHRQAPPSEDFEKSVEAFFTVVKRTKPDVIFVWGARLWKYLRPHLTIDMEGTTKKAKFTSINPTIIVTHHPSSPRFGKSHWASLGSKISI